MDKLIIYGFSALLVFTVFGLESKDKYACRKGCIVVDDKQSLERLKAIEDKNLVIDHILVFENGYLVYGYSKYFKKSEYYSKYYKINKFKRKGISLDLVSLTVEDNKVYYSIEI